MDSLFRSATWSTDKRKEPSQANIQCEVGSQVIVLIKHDNRKHVGRVEFVGTTDFADGTWYGLNMKEPVGKHDGSFMGRSYFKCKNRHGVFVRPNRIVRLYNAPSSTAQRSPSRKAVAGGLPPPRAVLARVTPKPQPAAAKPSTKHTRRRSVSDILQKPKSSAESRSHLKSTPTLPQHANKPHKRRAVPTRRAVTVGDALLQTAPARTLRKSLDAAISSSFHAPFDVWVVHTTAVEKRRPKESFALVAKGAVGDLRTGTLPLQFAQPNALHSMYLCVPSLVTKWLGDAPLPLVVDSRDQWKDHVKQYKRVYASNVRGLFNLGNTCFFNAVLQCLCHTPLFRLFFLLGSTRVGTRKGHFFSMSRELVRELHSSQITNEPRNLRAEEESGTNLLQRRSPFRPDKLFGAICKRVPEFASRRQQDALELFKHLLDGLHQDLAVSGSNQSIVERVFGGELKSTVTCLQCGRKSTVSEQFFELTLPIPRNLLAKREQKPRRGGRRVVHSRRRSLEKKPEEEKEESITACLDLFTAEETIKQWNCPECAKAVNGDHPLPPPVTVVVDEAPEEKTNSTPAEAEEEVKEGSESEEKEENSSSVSAGEEGPSAVAEKPPSLVSTEDANVPSSDVKEEETVPLHARRGASKKYSIAQAPSVLVLALKRFASTGRRNLTRKLTSRIRVPPRIDLRPYMSDGSEHPLFYDLCAMTVHSGSIKGGHYSCFARRAPILPLDVKANGELDTQRLQRHMSVAFPAVKAPEVVESPRLDANQQWYYITDSRARVCALEDVLNKEAFLLFYEQMG